MKAIILAAGAGRRLGYASPKCLVNIGGKTILSRQLTALLSSGISEVVLVVGFQEDQVRSAVTAFTGDVTFVRNEDYGTTNTLYSLYLARNHLDDEFLQLNGDVVFDRRLIELLLRSTYANALAVRRGRCGDEEVKVIVDSTGRIQRIGKDLEASSCYGEAVGVSRFSKELALLYAAELTRAVEDEGAITAYFEYALQRLCPVLPLRAVSVGQLPVIEVDFCDDLAAARRLALDCVLLSE